MAVATGVVAVVAVDAMVTCADDGGGAREHATTSATTARLWLHLRLWRCVCMREKCPDHSRHLLHKSVA